MFTSKDVSDALHQAQDFAREGRFEEALERHIWYHDNALLYDPAQAGVRLSFGLYAWVRLAKKYPPAFEALKEIQNKQEDLFNRDPQNLSSFHDLMSIVIALDDMPKAKEVFYQARTLKIVDFFFETSLDKIVATNDTEWLRDVIDDPQERLNYYYNRSQSRYYMFKAMNFDDELIEAQKEASAKEIAVLVNATSHVYGEDKASELLAKANQLFDPSLIKNALDEED